MVSQQQESVILEIRKQNLLRIAERRGTKAAVTKDLGYTSPGYLTQMTGDKSGARSGRPITDATARLIEDTYRLPARSMDRPLPDAILAIITPEEAVSPAPKRVLRVRSREGPAAPEVAPETYITAFAAATELVARIAEEHGTVLTPPQWSKIITLVFDDATAHNGVREVYIRTLLDLIK